MIYIYTYVCMCVLFFHFKNYSRAYSFCISNLHKLQAHPGSSLELGPGSALAWYRWLWLGWDIGPSTITTGKIGKFMLKVRRFVTFHMVGVWTSGNNRVLVLWRFYVRGSLLDCQDLGAWFKKIIEYCESSWLRWVYLKQTDSKMLLNGLAGGSTTMGHLVREVCNWVARWEIGPSCCL